MALTTEDVQAIAAVIDGRFADRDLRERRSRWRWRMFWLVIIVVSTVLSWWPLQQTFNRIASQTLGRLDQLNAEERRADASYQRELARSALMQKERQEAQRNAHYTTPKSPADEDAALIRSLFKIYNESTALQHGLGDLDSNDPAKVEAATKATNAVVQDGMAAIMQMMLSETDPDKAAPVAAPPTPGAAAREDHGAGSGPAALPPPRPAGAPGPAH